MQQALKDKGHDPGPVDGQLGPSTENALRRFQQAEGLQASGDLDTRTLSALGVNEQGNGQAGAANGGQGTASSTTSGQGPQSRSSSMPSGSTAK